MADRYWTVCIRPRDARFDGTGGSVLADVHQLGLPHVEGVRCQRLYFLKGAIDHRRLTELAASLLADPVTESFDVLEGLDRRRESAPSVEVHYQPGVMDPVALTTLRTLRRALAARGEDANAVEDVRTGRRFAMTGARSRDELVHIARRLLANECIERAYVRGMGGDDPLPDRFPQPPQYTFALRHVLLRDLDDAGLTKLSREGHLFLSLDEMRAIQAHYSALKREPTDIELETLAQTWSEHCVHKTLKSAIDYEGDDFGRPGRVRVRFDNLLKDTIVRATRDTGRDWCLSVFVDNAGVIAFDDDYGVAFKVETHNHPSAIEPYGGAATGIGGCIRDIMGCGLGARPIASTDVFCLAPPDYPAERLPTGVLHPRRVLKGVVAGVRDYGNRMGIPTVNGAIHFDPRYLANPLVFCGCVGLIPRNRIEKSARPGDFVVVAGGRTGRDGIHGATFSSAELETTHVDEFSHAVQIGNAVEEKKVLDALLRARDAEGGCLYSAVTDCGAGGLSSAVGEMGAELGAEVDLEKVPLKYSGLRYDEIWISEAQERMVFAVPPRQIERFLSIFAEEEVEAAVIGRFTGDGRLRVRYDGHGVGDLDVHFLHEGLPRMKRRATWSASKPGEPSIATESGDLRENADPQRTQRAPRAQSEQKEQPGLGVGRATPAEGSPPNADAADGLRERLLAELRSLNVASKEWVIRQYDHEVQGRSVVKPLCGPGFGPSDAAVLRPRLDSLRAVALGCGLCPQASDRDPYWMAVLAVDEALRNVICVGADPRHTAILDNFCWPKCDNELALGTLVRACRGAADAAIALGLPFISGKDSLSNEFSMDPQEAKRLGLPQRLAIPPTLLISAISVLVDARRCVTMDLKSPGNVIALASAPVDSRGFEAALSMHQRVASLIAAGRIRGAHDVSDGGLLVALAEMSIASGLGLEIHVKESAWSAALFAPAATSYLLEMTAADAAAAELPVLGQVTDSPHLKLTGASGEPCAWSIHELASAWRAPLDGMG
ncbi:MAG: phosphoribosylformylglycinamidine synthase subunit PurS [Phycisphaerales bacterium]|nr:phosphoribosylformylglycinamidine synthase subunit PurS [Phycisphaerales bacterium]